MGKLGVLSTIVLNNTLAENKYLALKNEVRASEQ
jgi:hypothetical protein